jgi:hypothetical protein
MAGELAGNVFRNGEIEALQSLLRIDTTSSPLLAAARKLLQPFKSIVEEDDDRATGSKAHRRISATLTKQRRMHPAICKVVSDTFYAGKLDSEDHVEVERESTPFLHLDSLPKSPLSSSTSNMSVLPDASMDMKAQSRAGIIRRRFNPFWTC